jgi:hypothetical protein
MSTITYDTPDGVQTQTDVKVQYRASKEHWLIEDPEGDNQALVPRERVYSIQDEKSEAGGTVIEF